MSWSYLRVVSHDDVIKWKHFPRYWPFVLGIHRWPVTSPHKGQWRWTLMFSLVCVWINSRLNNREAGDLRRSRADYDVFVMRSQISHWTFLIWHDSYIHIIATSNRKWFASRKCKCWFIKELYMVLTFTPPCNEHWCEFQSGRPYKTNGLKTMKHLPRPTLTYVGMSRINGMPVSCPVDFRKVQRANSGHSEYKI